MARAALAACVAGLLAAPALAPASFAGGRVDVPDVALTDTAGRVVRLRSDVIGERVVALQFVFTRCTTVCPAMGVQFARVQALLGEAPFRLISVSIDPEHDTPERLAAWGRRQGAGASWALLTGAKEDVDRLQKACGVFAAEAARHSPTVVVLDGASGRFTRVSGLAPAQAVADAMTRMGQPDREQAAR